MAVRRNALVVGGAVLLVATGLLADARTPWDLERSIGQWVYDWPGWVETPLEAVQNVGTWLAIVVVTAGLVVAGRQRAAAAAALAATGAWLVSTMLKAWVDRPRPSLRLLGRVPRDVVESGTASWPSGHVTVAAALGTVLLLTVAEDRIARAVVVTAVVLTALARLYLGVHWVLDVLGSLGLGAAAAQLAVRGTRAT